AVFAGPMVLATDCRYVRYVVHRSPMLRSGARDLDRGGTATAGLIALARGSGDCRATLTCAAAECDAIAGQRRGRIRPAMHCLIATLPCTFLCTALRVAAFGLQRESA